MAKSTENEIIKSLSEENAELTESICSWSRNCAQLSNQVTKLKGLNIKLTAENAELKSTMDKNIDQLHVNSKDMKYVMELLEKTTLQNKELKAENAKLGIRLQNDQKVIKHTHNKKKMTEDENAELKDEIRAKDDLIKFYKEISDAKVSEVEELQQINRILKSKTIKVQQNK